MLKPIYGPHFSRDRGSIVLATKVFLHGDGADDSMPNVRGLSRGTIMHNVEQSLRRLKTDYIDLYYVSYNLKCIYIISREIIVKKFTLDYTYCKLA